MKKRILSMLLVAATALSLCACGGGSTEEASNETTETEAEVVNPGDPIIVSTMNDTEGEILGRMMSMILEDRGYEVVDNTHGYSGTVNGRTALLEDETDIYMDYTGRGLRLIENVDTSLYTKMDTAFESVSTWDAETNDLIWMCYAPFNNTDALGVRREWAEENDVFTMEDFAEYVNNGGEVHMLMHDYFATLSTGLPGFEEAYGFKLTEDQYVISGSNDEQLLAEGVDGTNIVHLYSSSGLVGGYDLVVLEDPKGVAPVYSPSPIIRKERLDKYPEIQDIMAEMFESISLDEMVEMNMKVQVDGMSGADVAKEYLLSKGLISE